LKFVPDLEKGNIQAQMMSQFRGGQRLRSSRMGMPIAESAHVGTRPEAVSSTGRQ
jgi:hypothetical protein